MNQPLEPRVSRLETIMEQILAQLNSIERRFDHIDGRFIQIETHLDHRFDSIDRRFESIETHFEHRFNQMETRLDRINHRFDLVYALVFSAWVTIILTILFHK